MHEANRRRLRLFLSQLSKKYRLTRRGFATFCVSLCFSETVIEVGIFVIGNTKFDFALETVELDLNSIARVLWECCRLRGYESELEGPFDS